MGLQLETWGEITEGFLVLKNIIWFLFPSLFSSHQLVRQFVIGMIFFEGL